MLSAALHQCIREFSEQGLLGINCGHQIYPFFPGLSTQTYQPTKDAAANDRDYAESQRQRYLERQVRNSKRECSMLDAMGDKEGFEKAALRLKQRQQTLRDFAGQTGRTLRVDRAQVAGYNRSVAGKATQSVRRQERYEQFAKNVRISSPKRAKAAQYQEYIKQVGAKKRSLNATDQAILDRLPKRYNWVQVAPEEANIYTLAALTAKTGDEFAMFAKDDTKIIIRGAANSAWSLPNDLSRRVFDEQLRWTGHSHPTTVHLSASCDDRTTLSYFTWQKSSEVIDLTGKIRKFSTNAFADIDKGW